MNIMEYVPYLIPFIIIELGLMISAIVHILRHRTYRFGNIYLWMIIALFLQFLGPILYFTIGKGEGE